MLDESVQHLTNDADLPGVFGARFLGNEVAVLGLLNPCKGFLERAPTVVETLNAIPVVKPSVSLADVCRDRVDGPDELIPHRLLSKPWPFANILPDAVRTFHGSLVDV